MSDLCLDPAYGHTNDRSDHSISQSQRGCSQRCSGFIAATTITTVVVIPVVIISLGLPTSVVLMLPSPISSASPKI